MFHLRPQTLSQNSLLINCYNHNEIIIYKGIYVCHSFKCLYSNNFLILLHLSSVLLCSEQTIVNNHDSETKNHIKCIYTPKEAIQVEHCTRQVHRNTLRYESHLPITSYLQAFPYRNIQYRLENFTFSHLYESLRRKLVSCKPHDAN